MGCTSAKPRVLGPTSSDKPGAENNNVDPNSAETISRVTQAASSAAGNGRHPSISNAVVLTSIDRDKPTTTGIALECIKTLVTTSQSMDTLAVDFFGDHDEFCMKLSQKPATAHFLKKKADVFICFPSTCTMQTLLQALSDVRDSPLFVWVDGSNTKTNGVERSTQYWSSLLEIYQSIGKGIVVSSPWSEPSPLPAIRCLEIFYAKHSGSTVLVTASKKECDEFKREMREKPLGPTRFHAVLDHEVEDTSSATPISEIIRENFVEIRSSIESVLRILVTRLANEMIDGLGDDDSEQTAVVLASRASLHYTCGELDDAMKRFQEAHSILLKARNSPLATSVLHNIAKIHEDLGQTQQAMDLYERCISIEQPNLGMKLSSGDLVALKTHTPTNQSTRASGKHDGFWRDSFNIPSPHDIGGATTLFNMACLLANKGENDRAEALFQESVAARRAYSANGESLDVAWCLNGMGVFYERIHKLDQAKECYQDALAIRRRCGANETLLSESLENLGSFLVLQGGDRDEGKVFLDEALALRVKHFGLDSIPVARTLVCLAFYWEIMQDGAKAKSFAQEAREVYRKSGEDSVAGQIADHFDL